MVSCSRSPSRPQPARRVRYGTYDIVPAASGATFSNYTVAPQNGTLTVDAWSADGFYQPVSENASVRTCGVQALASHSPLLNMVKGGSTVPLKFIVFAGVGGKEIVDPSKMRFTITSLAARLRRARTWS